MRQKKKNRTGLRSIYLIGLTVLIFITTVSFSYKHYSKNEPENRLKEIEIKMSDVRGTLDLVNLRRQNINKAISIINQFNSKMPEHKKLKIATTILL